MVRDGAGECGRTCGKVTTRLSAFSHMRAQPGNLRNNPRRVSITTQKRPRPSAPAGRPGQRLDGVSLAAERSPGVSLSNPGVSLAAERASGNQGGDRSDPIRSDLIGPDGI